MVMKMVLSSPFFKMEAMPFFVQQQQFLDFWHRKNFLLFSFFHSSIFFSRKFLSILGECNKVLTLKIYITALF